MAKRFDPTSQDYPTTLGMPPKGKNVAPGQYYGFSDDQIQQMKKAGITVGDLQGMGILRPPQMMTPAQGYSGGTIGGQIMSDTGKQQLQSAALLRASLAASAANQPQQQAAAAQPQMPQLGPTQPVPQIPITPLTPTAQFGANPAGAPIMPVPQASAQGTAPLFSLGAGQDQNWMLPQAQVPPPQATAMQATPGMRPWSPQPVQQFAQGGPVKPSNQPDPGFQTGTSDLGAQTGWYDPLYGGSALGAWALGMPLVVNPAPSGTPSAKSGVAQVGGPKVYQAPYTGGPLTLPGGQTFTAEQVANFNPADWAEVGKVGVKQPMPSSIAYGPWSQVPGLFNKAEMPTVRTQAAPGWTGTPNMPLTAQVPANAAQMPQMPITPAANAAGAAPQMAPPAAPGGQPGFAPHPFIGAHTSALADAGRALFAHFGGDPNSASPGDIANFHTQFSGMLGQLPQGRTTGAAGANVALATGPTLVPSGGPKKMQSGGPVPGQGDDDNVHALLTPGEYVLNKQQVKQLVQGRPVQLGQLPQQPQQPQRVQQPQQTQQGQSMTNPAATTGLGGGSDQTQQLANLMAARTMRQNAALSARLPAYPTATTPAAQGYAAAANAGQIGGGAPTTAELSKAAAMTPGQIQGSMAQANMPAAGAASAIGGIGAALAQAAQTYANSIKPWQVQASAIPNPDDFRRRQDISLQEPRVV